MSKKIAKQERHKWTPSEMNSIALAVSSRSNITPVELSQMPTLSNIPLGSIRNKLNSVRNQVRSKEFMEKLEQRKSRESSKTVPPAPPTSPAPSVATQSTLNFMKEFGLTPPNQSSQQITPTVPQVSTSGSFDFSDLTNSELSGNNEDLEKILDEDDVPEVTPFWVFTLTNKFYIVIFKNPRMSYKLNLSGEGDSVTVTANCIPTRDEVTEIGRLINVGLDNFALSLTQEEYTTVIKLPFTVESQYEKFLGKDDFAHVIVVKLTKKIYNMDDSLDA
jgi:hypothetical protein